MPRDDDVYVYSCIVLTFMQDSINIIKLCRFGEIGAHRTLVIALF